MRVSVCLQGFIVFVLWGLCTLVTFSLITLNVYFFFLFLASKCGGSSTDSIR